MHVKRDGRYLEKIGTYNPNTNPATVDINVDSAVQWLENGAQPTDTARTFVILPRRVIEAPKSQWRSKRKALTQEDVDAKFNAWLEEKGLLSAFRFNPEADARAQALAAEKEVIADAKAEEAFAFRCGC